MSFISLQRRMWKQWNESKGLRGKKGLILNSTGILTILECTVMWSHVTWDYLLFREKCGMNYGGRASLTRRLQSSVVWSGMQMGGWNIFRCADFCQHAHRKAECYSDSRFTVMTKSMSPVHVFRCLPVRVQWRQGEMYTMLVIHTLLKCIGY